MYLLSCLCVAVFVLPAAGLDRTVWAITAVVSGAVLLNFAINRLDGLSWSIPILHFIWSVAALIGLRSVARMRDHRRRARRRASPIDVLSAAPTAATETLLIVGMNRLSELYAQALEDFAPQKVQLAGLVGRSARHVGRLVGSAKVLGLPEDIKISCGRWRSTASL